MRRLLPPEEAALVCGKLDELMTGLASCFAQVDPLSIKHTVTDKQAGERIHPTFFPLSEQWETSTQAIQQLHCGQAFIRLPDDTVRRVATLTLPTVTVSPQQFSALREYYLQRYFRPVPQPTSTTQRTVIPTPEAPRPGPPPLRRYHLDDRTEPSSPPVTATGTQTGQAVFAPRARIRRHG